MMRLPGKPFLIAGALAWSGIVAAMLSVSREPTEASVPVTAPLVAKFDARWDASSADDYALLKKTDRLPLQEPGPIPKHPDNTLPPPATMPAVVATQDDDRPVSRRKHRERNACTRHGMRKVTTHGGRSWRCRK